MNIKKLTAWASALLLTTSLVACGGDDSEKELNNRTPESSTEKEFNMALFWLDANIEPTEGWNGWTLTRTGVGENLVQIDENMNFKPVVAESWEQTDDTTTIFTIRKDVKFHNGKTVDAEAVKESLERTLEITDREDVKFPVDSIIAEGQTLTIRTTEPFPTLINNLADPAFIIVDAEAAKGNDNFKNQPIATGAFQVVSFDAEKGLELKKHTEHWSGEIAVDKVNAKYLSDDATRVMALQSGEIDFATQIPAKDLTLFENNSDYNLQKGPNLRIFLLSLNQERSYMKDLKFRQALVHGIDKETYASSLVNGIPAAGPFNSELPFSYQGKETYQYDPEKANELLDDAGYKDTDGDGIREADGKNLVLKFVYATNHGNDAKSIGVAMQDQYKEIGIGLEMVQVENYADIVDQGDFDMVWERWTSAPTADPAYFVEAAYATGAAGNSGRYSNAEIDTIVNQFKTTFDKEQRNALGTKASELLMNDVASLFLYYQEGTVVTKKSVSGVERFISEIYYIDERLKKE